MYRLSLSPMSHYSTMLAMLNVFMSFKVMPFAYLSYRKYPIKQIQFYM